MRSLPGDWSMLIALVGNGKEDLAGLKSRREFDGCAEKHGVSTILF